jgi:two-component system cell cycle response regulator DivK
MNNLALVIEDDLDLSAIFAEALNTAGFETEIIRDGHVAKERLTQTQPALVLLDMHLPHISGADLLSQIQSDERLKDTIVIVATADARMGDSFRDEADFVLIKPISFTQLRDLTTRLHSNLK